MKSFIHKLLYKALLNESVDISRINDIEDDDLYDNFLNQAEFLAKNSEIGFGSADLFGIAFNPQNHKLVGATWLESSGNFTFHIIIDPKYQGKGLSRLLLDDLIKKYHQMKQYMGSNYKIVVNVVNDRLATTLAKHYGFKKIEDNGQGGIIMSNSLVNSK